MKNYNKKTIESVIGYTFQNPDLLRQAFTRSSYAEELRTFPRVSNEVLEFIGDSVLGILVTRNLIQHADDCIPSQTAEKLRRACGDGEEIVDPFLTCVSERELSEDKILLCSGKTLGPALAATGLHEYLFLGKSDLAAGVENEISVQEDLLEAILGAVVIDSNWDMTAAAAVLDRLLDPDAILEEARSGDDPIELLEQYCRDCKWDAKVVCEMTDRKEGRYPFRCELTVDLGGGFRYDFSARGRTEEGAKRVAARFAWRDVQRAELGLQQFYKAAGGPLNANHESSVRILDQLYRKHLIPEPVYEFTQGPVGENGNPQWTCFCSLSGTSVSSCGMTEDTKAEAKKYAAEQVLEMIPFSFCFQNDRSVILDAMMNNRDEIKETEDK